MCAQIEFSILAQSYPELKPDLFLGESHSCFFFFFKHELPSVTEHIPSCF